MNFRSILLSAKALDQEAMSTIIKMYKPLIVKESIVMGVFDEDLYQELLATLVNCIHKIKKF